MLHVINDLFSVLNVDQRSSFTSFSDTVLLTEAQEKTLGDAAGVQTYLKSHSRYLVEGQKTEKQMIPGKAMEITPDAHGRCAGGNGITHISLMVEPTDKSEGLMQVWPSSVYLLSLP